MEARQARAREEMEAPPPPKQSKKKGGGAKAQPRKAGPKPPSGGAQGSFHYLNVQKRLLRDYAKRDLDLGVRWRSTLLGVISSRGIDLGVTPSSQWTQEELECLYVYWGLPRPEPEELRARTCLEALYEGGDAAGLPNDGQSQSGPPRAKKQKCMEATTAAAAREESDEDVDDETTTLASSSSFASWPPHGQIDDLVFSSGSLFEVHETHHSVHESDTETTTTNFSEEGLPQGLYQGSRDGGDASSSTKEATVKEWEAPPADWNERIVTVDDLVKQFGMDLLPFLGIVSSPSVPPVEKGQQQQQQQGGALPFAFAPPATEMEI